MIKDNEVTIELFSGRIIPNRLQREMSTRRK